MKSVIKQSVYRVLFLCQLILLAECTLIDNSSISNYPIEITDITSNEIGHSHSTHFEVDTFVNDSTLKDSLVLSTATASSYYQCDFQSSFTSSIWQPPKRA